MKNQQAFLNGYKLLKIPILDSYGEPSWKEVFPLNRVEELRKTVGERHFQSQMMLNPMPLDKARLDTNSINFYDDDFDLKAARLGDTTIITAIALYWDPSTAHKRNDASVCVFLLRDEKNKRAFVHDCIYLKSDDYDLQPLTTQCNAVLDFMNQNKLLNIGIEVNGLGTALPEILKREALIRDQTVNVQRITNHRNKEERILSSIEPLLGSARLYMNEKIKDTNLIDEFNDWSPIGNLHDDGIDALAGALEMQPIPVHPHDYRFRPIKAKTDFNI